MVVAVAAAVAAAAAAIYVQLYSVALFLTSNLCPFARSGA